MDIFAGFAPNNYNKVRGRTLSTKEQTSRDSSISSTKSSIVYHERMECNNAMNIDVDMDNNSPALSYKTLQEKAIQVSEAADPQTNMMSQHGNPNISNLNPQCVLNDQMAPNPTCVQTTHHADDTVINIQLPYDPSAPMEPKLWNGSFHPISLHSSMEHLVLDSKNIQDSLNFMAKYISNKQVDSSKSNNLEDFHGIDKAVWNFISSVYQANWDSLYANKQSNSLRKKIVAKFTLKIQPATNKNKIIDKPTSANIKRIPPPIPTKFQEEVNQISKYFKNIKLANNTKQP